MCLEVFVQGMLGHVLLMVALLMVALEDHIQVVVVLDVLDPVCVYTLISVKIKTWTIDLEESHALAQTLMQKNTHTLHIYTHTYTHTHTHTQPHTHSQIHILPYVYFLCG
jgi:hypothetical protein